MVDIDELYQTGFSASKSIFCGTTHHYRIQRGALHLPNMKIILAQDCFVAAGWRKKAERAVHASVF
jgi:hypothetical protein